MRCLVDVKCFRHRYFTLMTCNLVTYFLVEFLYLLFKVKLSFPLSFYRFITIILSQSFNSKNFYPSFHLHLLMHFYYFLLCILTFPSCHITKGNPITVSKTFPSIRNWKERQKFSNSFLQIITFKRIEMNENKMNLVAKRKQKCLIKFSHTPI